MITFKILWFKFIYTNSLQEIEKVGFFSTADLTENLSHIKQQMSVKYFLVDCYRYVAT